MTLTGKRCSPALSPLHMHPATLSPGPVALPTRNSPAGVPRVLGCFFSSLHRHPWQLTHALSCIGNGVVLQLDCGKSSAVFGARASWCIIHGFRPHLLTCCPGAKQASPMGLVKAPVLIALACGLGSCNSERVSGLLENQRMPPPPSGTRK